MLERRCYMAILDYLSASTDKRPALHSTQMFQGFTGAQSTDPVPVLVGYQFCDFIWPWTDYSTFLNPFFSLILRSKWKISGTIRKMYKDLPCSILNNSKTLLHIHPKGYLSYIEIHHWKRCHLYIGMESCLWYMCEMGIKLGYVIPGAPYKYVCVCVYIYMFTNAEEVSPT